MTFRNLQRAAAVGAAILALLAAACAAIQLPAWTAASLAVLASAAALASGVLAARVENEAARSLAVLAAELSTGDSAAPKDTPPSGESLVEAARARAQAGQRALALLDYFPFPFMSLTRAGGLRWMNLSMAGILGQGRLPRETPMNGPFFSHTSAGSWEAMLSGEWEGPLLRFERGGAEFYFQVEIAEVEPGQDRWLAIFIDMTRNNLGEERIEAQQAEIRQLAHKIHGATTGLERDVLGISDVLGQLVDTMHDSKDQARKVACAMQEMTDNVRVVATMAAESSRTAQTAEGSAREGMDEVKLTAEVTRKVVDSYDGLKAILTELVERAGNIQHVTEIISGIADQTNLLALNAAIEAARAGEAGRGFAVVADEVRKLAEKTIQATAEVQDAVGAIDQSSRQAVTAMEATSFDIGRTAELVGEVEGRFLSIAEAMVSTSRDIGDIARRAEAQCASSFEINMCAMNVTDNSEEVSDKVDQTSGELKRLVAEAGEARSLAARYVGSGEDFSEQRRHDRFYIKAYPTRMTCAVSMGGGEYTGEVLDLSPTGVRLRLLEKASASPGLQVTLAGCSCWQELGLNGSTGQVRWANGRELGLELTSRLPFSASRLQELVSRC